jgi:hypothetical protein
MPELKLELEIDYENNGITTRRVSIVDYEWTANERAIIISGYCHLRQSVRSFKSSKIKRCLDLTTSSIISDLPDFMRTLEGRPAPAIDTQIVRPISRSQQKYHLRKKFVPDVLYYQFKRRFFFLFNDQCFKCGRRASWRCVPENDSYMGGILLQEQLVMDHHIPFEAGGMFDAGNLVLLCKKCNGMKRSSLPSAFYSDPEIARLDLYLQVQEQLFPAGRRYWSDAKMEAFIKANNQGRADILLSEGINDELVRCCLHFQDHYYFCGAIASEETTSTSCSFTFRTDHQN